MIDGFLRGKGRVKRRRRIVAQEVELLTHVSNGLKTPEIAKAMRHTPSTIESYRIKLMRRLKAKNTAHMVRIGFERNLLTA